MSTEGQFYRVVSAFVTLHDVTFGAVSAGARERVSAAGRGAATAAASAGEETVSEQSLSELSRQLPALLATSR